ncbi:hypothetical protein TSUD_205070 [Trifolium subterraneum]|uniref:Uncharacterized protein n=1 Tax=Trifolium subterraneum TaxID=3900 RepID=A0A2Z6MV55_TRISU|nr:hypothetical protein TSUD_205070 [Trifolium subterraneum]
MGRFSYPWTGKTKPNPTIVIHKKPTFGFFGPVLHVETDPFWVFNLGYSGLARFSGLVHPQ